jgi:hypothetical protein
MLSAGTPHVLLAYQKARKLKFLIVLVCVTSSHELFIAQLASCAYRLSFTKYNYWASLLRAEMLLTFKANIHAFLRKFPFHAC